MEGRTLRYTHCCRGRVVGEHGDEMLDWWRLEVFGGADALILSVDRGGGCLSGPGTAMQQGRWSIENTLVYKDCSRMNQGQT